ncbi:MAG TPA: hypothetical protein VLT91_12955 [Rhizomicrobium sp.]|nr:hypothetical protein [Rhizomicrobium sp.]
MLTDSNLTGVWQGLYSYPRALEPGLFTVTLIETGTSLSGSTSEVWPRGKRAGDTILSFLSGHRRDYDVDFVKTYEGPDKPNHSVHYDGTLTGDFLEIEGLWHIPGQWSGRFLMIRSGTKSVAEARRKFQRA